MKSQPKWIIGGIVMALLAIGGFVVVRLCVLNFYTVPTASMMPTIEPGALVFGHRLAYRKPDDVRRGDIVFHRVRQKETTVTYVKRVVGLPGDRVRVRGLKVFVNDAELPTRFLRETGVPLKVFEESNGAARYEVASSPNPDPRNLKDVDIVVPANSFFLLGDNRTNSLDSRYLGSIEWRDLEGKILFHGPTRDN